MKLHNCTTALALAALMLPGLSIAQFDTGGPSTLPWKQFKLNSKTRIQLNFKNASVDMILALLGKKSGITIVKDPNFKDPLTVNSAKAVSLDEAFQIINTLLELKNYTFTKSGNILVVKAKGPDGPPPGFNPDTSGARNRDKLELRVYPIKFANASEVARVLNDVFSQQPGGNQPNPFFGGRGRFGGFNLGNAGGDQTQKPPQVRASSDDFSNSVIVNASTQDQVQVKSILDQIDKQTVQPVQTRVFHLKFANANDVAALVQNVLTSNAPKGIGGAGNQSVDFGQRIGQAFRFGNGAAGFGEVVAEVRSNSLVVTGTTDSLTIVEKVLLEIDKPTDVQDTTFVFTLANAKADQVAGLFQQAFGNRQGVSGGGFNPNAPTNRTNTAQGRAGTSTFGSGNGSGRPPGANNLQDENQNNLALAMQDPSAANGELLTSIAAQGGFLQRILGGGQGGQQPATTRNGQGQIVNTRDLSGQITVIPDVNTNSIIVVTSPENVALVKSILDQLDKLPQQVMIETVIVEATLDKSSRFGLEWKFAQNKVFGDPAKSGVGGTNFGLQSASPALQGFSYTLTGGDLGAFFNALKTDTKFEVLSTPRIFTSNNQQAVINISQSVPYVTNTIQNSNGSTSYSYAFENVGIVLTVTPRITANGFVTMDIDQTANDLQGYTSFNAPIVNQREANTSVSVKDGNTIILGGIIRKTVTATTNKVPLLGDIPLLGQIFRSSSKDVAKTELLVFLTPHLVKDADDAQKLRERTTDELSPGSQKNVFDSLHPKAPPVKKP